MSRAVAAFHASTEGDYSATDYYKEKKNDIMKKENITKRLTVYYINAFEKMEIIQQITVKKY